MVNRRFLTLTLVTLLGALLIACGSGGDDEPAAAQPTAARPATQPTAGVRGGPAVTIDPRSGPPGTQVTVTGTGWPAGTPVTVVGAQAAGNAAPYAQLSTNNDGIFTAKFRLEKAPDGTDLKVGRFDLVARSSGEQVLVPFQVEVPRPVRNQGDGG